MAETVQDRLRGTKRVTQFDSMGRIIAFDVQPRPLELEAADLIDTLIKERDEARESERERCTAIVDNMRRLLSHEYTDPNPQYNTVAKAREFAAMMAEISLDAIRDGHISERALLPPTVHNDGGKS